mgnify:CR=1 FL=1
MFEFRIETKLNLVMTNFDQLKDAIQTQSTEHQNNVQMAESDEKPSKKMSSKSLKKLTSLKKTKSTIVKKKPAATQPKMKIDEATKRCLRSSMSLAAKELSKLTLNSNTSQERIISTSQPVISKTKPPVTNRIFSLTIKDSDEDDYGLNNLHKFTKI